MKIAIIGSGISGLTAAHILCRDHEVSVFEKDSRLGGHTATVDVNYKGESLAIDTGFIVYNERTYPNFIRLLDKLNVKAQKTLMGFSVFNPKTGLEYAGNSINAMFAQRKNIFSLSFWMMLKDIVRFNKESVRDLDAGLIKDDMTLGEYLDQNAYSESFCRNYLVPMGAAIWSASFESMKNFPVTFFVRFFHNHGLLTILDHPQWYVIKGGSRSYIDPLIQGFKNNIHLNSRIDGVLRTDDASIQINFADGSHEKFDQVIFATHSDQALKLLSDASKEEREILGAIKYKDNDVVLHTDVSLLPKKKITWSSWNYLLDNDDCALPILTYNMNILQSLDSQYEYNVTLNANDRINPDSIIEKFVYAHPQFSIPAMKAQGRWAEINGVNNTWFCGAYWANGFHEDGVASALKITEKFGLDL